MEEFSRIQRLTERRCPLKEREDSFFHGKDKNGSPHALFGISESLQEMVRRKRTGLKRKSECCFIFRTLENRSVTVGEQISKEMKTIDIFFLTADYEQL
ncbi:hypothetical protein TNCV_223891 [Trichonephila clavipes]|nr:hypothetical protein TNCV_223891 [Trichonephila clavipes]